MRVSSAAFARVLSSEIEKWRRVAREAKNLGKDWKTGGFQERSQQVTSGIDISMRYRLPVTDASGRDYLTVSGLMRALVPVLNRIQSTHIHSTINV